MRLSVLTDFRQRGVSDVFIACVDGLKGFPEAIEATFPATQVQPPGGPVCIVHQIRTSLRFIPDKHLKPFVQDLKSVYQADDRAMAKENLLLLQEKWVGIYPKAVQPWERLAVYFDYPAEIRKIVYTTNTIEAYSKNHKNKRRLRFR